MTSAALRDAIEEIEPGEVIIDEILAATLAQPPDADTHLDLAVAYLEMELPHDAVTEAGEALRLGKLAHKRASEALHIVLDPKFLLERVEFALDRIRDSTFQN
ncbi:MAG: hypothetical protein JNM17_17660 [Archangium sp.]|nr:hypothetical protein [Archangium sp.]